MQEILGEGPQLLRRFDQPLQHGIGVDFEHPRRAPDAQAFGQARDDAYDELDRHALAMEERPERLEKVAAADHTQPLPPGTATGMAIGADIPPSDPALVPTVRIRAEMGGGVDLASSPPRGHEAWWSCGGLRAGGGGVLTGVAGRLGGEACKGLGLTVALGQWGCGL